RANQPSPAAWSSIPATISGRVPIRSDSAPASGATTRAVAVQGRTRTPVPNGENPRANWKYWDVRKAAENSAPVIRKEGARPAKNAGILKSRSGSIGSDTRRPQTRKAAISTSPRPNAATTSGLPQPASLARTRPQTMPIDPADTNPTPGRSSRVAGPWLSLSRVAERTAATSPMGTLTQKIPCQLRPSVTAPPMTGRRASASPARPPQAPMTGPGPPGGRAAVGMVGVSGVTIAAPIPWTARAATRFSADGASAHAADPAVNSDSPAV